MDRDQETPANQRCFRCGSSAELAVPRSNWIGSEPESQLPLCPECLELLTTNPKTFWEPLQRKPGSA